MTVVVTLMVHDALTIGSTASQHVPISTNSPFLQTIHFFWFHLLICVITFDLPTLAHAQTLPFLLGWVFSKTLFLHLH